MYLLESCAPLVIVGVGFTLMYQHTLYDTALLSDLGHIDNALIAVHIILLGHIHKPVAAGIGGLHCKVLLAGILVPEFQLGAGYRDVDYTYTVLLGELLNHLAAKEIDRTHVVALTADRGCCGIPFTFYAVVTRHIHGRYKLETGIVPILVLIGRSGSGLHVGLAKAQVNEEIGIRRLSLERQSRKDCCREKQ